MENFFLGEEKKSYRRATLSTEFFANQGMCRRACGDQREVQMYTQPKRCNCTEYLSTRAATHTTVEKAEEMDSSIAR